MTNTNNEIVCELVVLGSGPGGYTAAFRASDLGLKVVLIEKHSTLGGVCLNVGCIPSKSLLHIAKVINESKEMEQHGLSFGQLKFDLAAMRSYKSNIVKKLTQGLDMLAAKRQVQIIRGEGQFNTPNTIKVTENDGKVQIIRFNKAIIAAGSHAFKIPGFPIDDRIINSTQALDLNDIPAKMLIVGGGVIGLEMAEIYSSLGAAITIVELGDHLIPNADRDLVKILENRIKKRYSAIYTKTKCSLVQAQDDGIYITLVGAVAPIEPQCFDKVLIATGRRPNGNTIGAVAAGIVVNDQGFVKVNSQQRTNVAHIFAIGDIVGQPMLAHKATHEGKIAAENCAGLNVYFDAKVIPAIAYTDPEIAWVGINELEAQQQKREIKVGKFPWGASGRALSNGRDDGFTKIISDKSSGRIIGAGIVGVNAGELLSEACLAIEMGADIHDVALTIHPHPTLAESLALSCEMIDGSITDLYLTK